MRNPVNSTFGKIRTGSLVSSAMLTESSKPTIAKNASDVAVVTARKAFLSSAVSKATTREKSIVAALGERPETRRRSPASDR